MTFLIRTVAAGAMCAALAAGPALAQEMSEEEQEQARLTNAVETRQAVFKLLGYNFQPLGAMLRDRDAFDIEQIQVATDRMLALAPMIEEVFAEDTRDFDGAETAARDAIWQSQDAFNQKAADLQSALGELKEAADSGERGPTTRALAAVGQTCGSCHDDYRND